MSGGEWFHAGIKAMKRSAGKSAVASAAYRMGARLEDKHYGMVRDFSRKSDVVACFTVAPEGAPEWASDAEALWNAVEKRENRKNSVLAYEWEASLPHSVTPGVREDIAHEFADWLRDEYGVAVTVGIHEGKNGNGNDHMHVMMTTREIGPEGWGAKVREFSSKPGMKNPEVDRVRAELADLINEALESSGSSERVDHRSFKERGIDQEPTKHLGPTATAYERQGIGSDRGDINRDIEARNREAIEERLRWMGQAELEITAALEREFSARWGDDMPPRSEWREAAPVGNNIQTEAPSRADVEQARQAPGQLERSRWADAWSAAKQRARGVWDGFADLWGEATADRPQRGDSYIGQVLNAGKKLWSGQRHHDGRAMEEGLKGAAHIVGEIAVDESGPAPPPGEPAREPESTRWRDYLLGKIEEVFHDRSGAGRGLGFSDTAWHEPGAELEGEEGMNSWEPEITEPYEPEPSPDGPDIDIE
jgi:hypothetical protein